MDTGYGEETGGPGPRPEGAFGLDGPGQQDCGAPGELAQSLALSEPQVKTLGRRPPGHHLTKQAVMSYQRLRVEKRGLQDFSQSQKGTYLGDFCGCWLTHCLSCVLECRLPESEQLRCIPVFFLHLDLSSEKSSNRH